MINHFFLLCLTFILTTSSLHAQEKRSFLERYYADVKVGALFFHDLDSGAGNFQFTTGAGYRFTSRHALGIGYHSESVSGAYTGSSFQGIGLDYRYASHDGFIFKAGGGKVLSGTSYSDDPGRPDEYTGGGYFVDFSIDYQLRVGITFGVFLSYAGEMQFDAYDYDYGTESDVFFGQVTEQQANLGISIGFALPGRRIIR